MRTGAAGRLKACGLKAGMPDILVFHNGLTTGIELKTDVNKLTSVQLAMFNRLANAGIIVSVCRTIDEVHTVLTRSGIPLRKFKYATSFKTPEGRRPQEPAQGEGRT